MTDLIDRKSAIVRATKVIEDDGVAHDVMEALRDMPSARQKGKWIKCEDELPPVGEEVLVWAYDRCYLLTLYEYPHNEGYYWSVDNYDIVDDAFNKVIAWMPLPQYSEDV